MHLYRAYGLTIASDFELPELPPAYGAPEVHIRRQPLHYEEAGVRSNGGFRIEGYVLDVLRFRVEGGHTVVVDNVKDVSEDEIRVYLLGVLMSLLLRQRGYLALHASALAKEGKAIAFVGDSGWGKSTLAGYFVQQGYRVFNDDVLALSLEPEAILVIPGYPQIKFRPEAEVWLGDRYRELAPLHESSVKRVEIAFDQFQEEALPLTCLYVLEPVGRNEVRIEDLSPRDALLELIQHTRMTHVLRDAEMQKMHFEQCSEVVRRVPVRRLVRRKDLNALGEIFECVEEDMSRM